MCDENPINHIQLKLTNEIISLEAQVIDASAIGLSTFIPISSQKNKD